MTITGGSLPSNISLSFGRDADKPLIPTEGKKYIATDTKKEYNCYVAGEWVDVSPTIIPNMCNFDYNNPITTFPGRSGTSGSATYTYTHETADSYIMIDFDIHSDQNYSYLNYVEIKINGIRTDYVAQKCNDHVVNNHQRIVKIAQGDVITIVCYIQYTSSSIGTVRLCPPI